MSTVMKTLYTYSERSVNIKCYVYGLTSLFLLLKSLKNERTIQIDDQSFKLRIMSVRFSQFYFVVNYVKINKVFIVMHQLPRHFVVFKQQPPLFAWNYDTKYSPKSVDESMSNIEQTFCQLVSFQSLDEWSGSGKNVFTPSHTISLNFKPLMVGVNTSTFSKKKKKITVRIISRKSEEK